MVSVRIVSESDFLSIEASEMKRPKVMLSVLKASENAYEVVRKRHRTKFHNVRIVCVSERHTIRTLKCSGR
jgi:1,2-phenylacetyl-CoA epoxidase PaaB subunit